MIMLLILINAVIAVGHGYFFINAKELGLSRTQSVFSFVFFVWAVAIIAMLVPVAIEQAGGA